MVLSAAPCLLCRHTSSTVADQLSGQQLRHLYKAVGREFSEKAWGHVRPETNVTLQRCSNCGFEFFDPNLAGGESFYRETDDPAYYSPFRPEFPRSLKFARARGLRRILDVGCGRGDFLSMARSFGLETCGLELNTTAAEKAHAAGHHIFNKLLHELQPEETGRFDLITLFQVIEHVPSPPDILKQAARFLAPNGAITVAVPASGGILKALPYDPGNWPPHHLSRWRLQDFATLAQQSDLRLIKSGSDLLLGSDLEFIWNTHRKLAPVIGRRPTRGTPGLTQLVCLVYRKAGLKFLFPRLGRSIYAYFSSR
jgi:2-polyprenyl-3-methyl-5-hydroxy-6-metoxy-1,4-benzoquinol methylase